MLNRRRLLLASAALLVPARIARAQSYSPLLGTSPFFVPPSGSIFVATNGNDSTGTGSITAPYLTLSKACTVVAANGNIVMRGGTYTSGSLITLATAGVTVQAYGAEVPILDGNAAADVILFITADHCTIRLLQFQNCLQAGSVNATAILIQGYYCSILGCNFPSGCLQAISVSASWALIQGNRILNTKGAFAGSGAILIATGGNNCTVDSNIIDTLTNVNAGTNWSGIQIINCIGTTITHNILRNLGGSAISVHASATHTSAIHTVIQYNYCTNCTITSNDSGVIHIDNIAVQTDMQILIDNNYCGSNGPPAAVQTVGIYLDDFSSGCVVTNNICLKGDLGLQIHAGMNNLFQNNIFDMGTSTVAGSAAGFIQGQAGGTPVVMAGNVVAGNLIYSQAVSAPTNIWIGNTGQFAANIYKNWYYNTNAQTMTNVAGIADSAPITGQNPLFISPSTGNYDMTQTGGAGTDVTQGGFVPINQTLMGLRPSGYIHWPTGWA